MNNEKALEAAIAAIHRTLGEAEHQLSQLGDRLQFLIGPTGEVEIVRRGKSGAAQRPKVVIAELKGCDPMLWRADCPAWLQLLAPRRAPGDPLSPEDPESAAEPGEGPESRALASASADTTDEPPQPDGGTNYPEN